MPGKDGSKAEEDVIITFDEDFVYELPTDGLPE